MNNGKRLLISKITLFLVVTLFLYILYIIYFPIKPLVLYPPYQIKTKIVKQGGFLTYTAKYCKYLNINATVSRNLIDKDNLTWVIEPTDGIASPTGCYERDISVHIPNSIPPNTYYMNIFSVYKINFFRTFTTSAYTDKFEVIK